eukprot:scaffold191962_cov31-Prasinocladus_malaysianus.AAC.1
MLSQRYPAYSCLTTAIVCVYIPYRSASGNYGARAMHNAYYMVPTRMWTYIYIYHHYVVGLVELIRLHNRQQLIACLQ